MRKFILASLLFTSISAFAANNGKITHIDFTGVGDPSHPDVVQLQIEGGFSAGACNTTYAAIRKADSHLVSAALTAFSINKPIIVGLNQNDLYYNVASNFPNRCTIDFLRMTH